MASKRKRKTATKPKPSTRKSSASPKPSRPSAKRAPTKRPTPTPSTAKKRTPKRSTAGAREREARTKAREKSRAKPKAKPTKVVKSARPAKPAKPGRPAKQVKPVRKQTPAQRRAEVARQRQAERQISEARRALRNERRRERYRLSRLPPNSPELLRDNARRWLERIREDVANVFPVSLDILDMRPAYGGGHADLARFGVNTASLGSEQGGTPWMIVGRYTPQDDIGYRELAAGLMEVEADYRLEVDINPNRLSQIRIVFSDPEPNSRRGEGDSVVSQIGAWSYIISDIVAELVGTSIDTPDEDSLAARYQDTTVPSFYVFFSNDTRVYRDVGPWMRTGTVKLS